MYLHARYYDPALGIFISPDPIGPEGGLNSYAYALDNPISGADRSGLRAAQCARNESCGTQGPSVLITMDPESYFAAIDDPGLYFGALGYDTAAMAIGAGYHDWQEQLIQDGNGGAYTYTGADGQTKVTLSPNDVTDFSAAEWGVATHLESGLSILVDVQYVPIEVPTASVIMMGDLPPILWMRPPPIRLAPNQMHNPGLPKPRVTPPRPFLPRPQPAPVIEPTLQQQVPRMPWWFRILFP